MAAGLGKGKGKKGETSTAGATDETEQGGETKGGGRGEEKGEPPE